MLQRHVPSPDRERPCDAATSVPTDPVQPLREGEEVDQAARGLQQTPLSLAAVQLRQDQSELGRAGQDHGPRSRPPIAVEPAGKSPALLDPVHERASGSLPAHDEAVLSKGLARFDQPVDRVAERVGAGGSVARGGVVAEIEPAVAQLVSQREFAVGACGAGVVVVRGHGRQPRERRGRVDIVGPLHSQVAGPGPAPIRVLVAHHPIRGPHRGFQVALVPRLPVGPGQAADDLTGVEHDWGPSFALVQALESALWFLHPKFPVGHADRPLRELVPAEQPVVVPKRGNDVAGHLGIPGCPAMELEVPDTARRHPILGAADPGERPVRQRLEGGPAPLHVVVPGLAPPYGNGVAGQHQRVRWPHGGERHQRQVPEIPPRDRYLRDPTDSHQDLPVRLVVGAAGGRTPWRRRPRSFPHVTALAQPPRHGAAVWRSAPSRTWSR